MAIARSVAGVCVVRDARDIVGLLCGHYLRVGFARLAFVDDGSSDGTFERLVELGRIDSRISVRRVVCADARAAEWITDLANELIARGYSTIVPFDADEFWMIDATEIERRYAGQSEIAFKGLWTSFVQNDWATYPRALSLFGIRYAAPTLADSDPTSVTAFRKSFLCCAAFPKWAFKTARAVEIGVGQHALVQGPEKADPTTYEIFHIPLRCKSEIVKRGLNYEPRRMRVRTQPQTSWQSAFHREVVLAGRVDEVWAANSADRRGCMNVFGESLRLRRDERLRWLLMKSFAYMLARHRAWAA